MLSSEAIGTVGMSMVMPGGSWSFNHKASSSFLGGYFSVVRLSVTF